MNDYLQIVEEYNKDGICIKRTINGYKLPADKEPSIQIWKNCSSITQKFYMSKEDVKNKYPEEFKLNNL